MQNLILSAEVVLPLFIMLAIGYVIKKLGVASEKALTQMNNVCFRVFLPLLLFVSIYESERGSVFNSRLLVFAAFAVIAIFLIAFAVVCLFEKGNAKRGVLIQAFFRSNFIIFGVPITISLCGPENAGAPAIVGAIVVPMYNILSVVALSIFSKKEFSIKNTLLQIAKNPLVIASVIAVLMLMFSVPLPDFILSAAEDLAQVATPLALVILGGSFEIAKVKSNLRNLLLGVLGKLVIIPMIMLPIAVSLGFRDVDLVVCLSMFCAPTAVASFTMAQQMGGDSELAGELVVFTAFFSIITIFGFVFTLKQLSLI